MENQIQEMQKQLEIANQERQKLEQQKQTLDVSIIRILTALTIFMETIIFISAILHRPLQS